MVAHLTAIQQSWVQIQLLPSTRQTLSVLRWVATWDDTVPCSPLRGDRGTYAQKPLKIYWKKIIETEQYLYKPVQNKTTQVHCPTNPWNMCNLKSYIIPDKPSHFDNIPHNISIQFQATPAQYITLNKKNFKSHQYITVPVLFVQYTVFFWVQSSQPRNFIFRNPTWPEYSSRVAHFSSQYGQVKECKILQYLFRKILNGESLS